MMDENDTKNLPIIIEDKNTMIENFITASQEDSAIKDFEIARANILAMLKSGSLSVERLADLAERSQNTRTYEVLYNFISSMVQANKELLEIQKKIRELKDPNISSNMNAKTINQTAIYCGSTAELQKVIKTMNLEKITNQDIIKDENKVKEENFDKNSV
jgi:hypothetical protein